MAYQIKSTPYFRRMLTTSKRNGQLQKLKEEYDQIKVFNEHSIEMKMRQVRLKRLFKEIEEIKETSNLKKRNLGPKKKTADKTKEDERLKNLIKARDLGMYFSRRNASCDPTMVPSNGYTKFGLLSQKHEQERNRLEEELLKARVAKRIKYGNDISCWNMYKLQRNVLRKEMSHGLSENHKQSDEDDPKDHKGEAYWFVEKEKLKQLTSYRDITSDTNINEKPKQQKTLSFSIDCIGPNSKAADEKKSPLLHSKNMRNLVKERNYADVEAMLFKSCDDVNDNQVIVNDQQEATVSCNSSDAEKRMKAKAHWWKLTDFIRGSLIFQRPKPAFHCLDQHEGIVENQLRYVTNGTNLPQTDIIPFRDEQLNLSENDDEYNNEKFFNSENLYESISPYRPPSPSAPSKWMQLKMKPVKKVSKEGVIDRYATYPLDAAKKQACPTGVQEMRRIFEHLNE